MRLLAIWFLGLAWAQNIEVQITSDQIAEAETLIGLALTFEERELMRGELDRNKKAYTSLRDWPVSNEEVPATLFHPGMLAQVSLPHGTPSFPKNNKVKRPADLNEVAFWPVRDLASLIRSKQVTSLELTELYLTRLKKYGPELECVITLTEDLAKTQARQADQMLAQGTYKGPLHGIPYGVKDLLSTQFYKTTWGAKPFADQVLEMDATIIKSMEQHGAVMVAKLSLGALAWGDVWYGGKTRSPWNLEHGSSGSSAGSASATAAGLVPFAIGSETWGSIVSPATRCQITGLRPSFGRVSRSGAMALSWTMDKLGPITRDALDAAIVFETIRGADPGDPYSVGGGFPFNADAYRGMTIGTFVGDFDETDPQLSLEVQALRAFQKAKFKFETVNMPDLPISAMSIILSSEAGAAFDELTRSDLDDELVRQLEQAWPNTLRASRFIPAVEYIQAQRLRVRLVQAMEALFEKVDVIVCPSFAGDQLLATNLSGHPCVVLPLGFYEGKPRSLSIIGPLYREDKVLAAANWFQSKTEFHRPHPPRYAKKEVATP